MPTLPRRSLLASATVLAASRPRRARAELSRVRVATQIGLAYLPFIVMEHDKLWEDEARQRGVPVEVEYSRLGGGAPLNDALLSGSAQVVSAGVTPMLTTWDRTRGNMRIAALSAINASPMDILTNRPEVKTLHDFTTADRIAVASVKVSLNALMLEMGVEQAFGPGQWGALNSTQVELAHPEAYTALVRHVGGITGWVATSPFQERAVKLPGIHKVTDSFQILGHSGTLSVNYAQARFVEENPKLVAAMLAAQQRAVDLIAHDRPGAIDKYLAITNDSTDRALIEQILSGPYDFSLVPQRTMSIAQFMYKIGMLKTLPASWKDYFFPEAHGWSGS